MVSVTLAPEESVRQRGAEMQSEVAATKQRSTQASCEVAEPGFLGSV